tara:strand:- start:344 stop:583 length:240 start_codon:yes stop_codon:yes gene_type:complete
LAVESLNKKKIKMTEKEETTTVILNEILNARAGTLDHTIYLVWMYGHFEDWPKDVDAVLPGVFKTVLKADRVGSIEGSA